MSLNVNQLLSDLQGFALSSGYFERGLLHEPKGKPGQGLTAAIWCESIGPSKKFGGLAVTSALVTFMFRIYGTMTTFPQDAIEPDLMNATAGILQSVSAAFSMNGDVNCIDLLGIEGVPLSAKSGYGDLDGKLYRIFDITVPVIVDDVWTQAA